MSAPESDGSRLFTWLLVLRREVLLVLPLEGRFTCIAFVERAGERDAVFAADRAVAVAVLVLGDVVALLPDPVRVLAVRAAAFLAVPAVRSDFALAVRLPVRLAAAPARLAAVVRPALVVFFLAALRPAVVERLLAATAFLPAAGFAAAFAFAVLLAFFLAGLFTDAMSAAPGSL